VDGENIGINHHKGENYRMLEQYGEVITIDELREILNIGRNAAYDLLNKGEISAFRIGRNWKIPRESVAHYIAQWKRK